MDEEHEVTGHAKDKDDTLTDAILALRRAATSLDIALREAARLAGRGGGSDGIAA